MDTPDLQQNEEARSPVPPLMLEPARPAVLFRWKSHLGRLARPIAIIAGVGTVVGGLAGYVTFYRTVSGSAGANGESSKTLLTAVAPIAQPISILVLPFANQTGDPAKTYVADGLTTALTRDLSRLRDAVIVPPLVAAGLQDKKLTLQQLGREARVRFVLQGSVITNGDKARITAQLADTRSGTQLWAGTFEGRISEIFTLLDNVTLRIRTSVGPEMILKAVAEVDRTRQSPTVADLLLQTDSMGLQQRSVIQLQVIETLSRRVLAIEPRNTRAMENLAFTLAIRVTNFSDELKLDDTASTALLSEAAGWAHAVLVADPMRASPYFVIGIFQWLVNNNIDAARQAFLHQVEIAPEPGAYNTAAYFYMALGESERAEELMLKALEFPTYLPPVSVYANLCSVSMQLARFSDAIRWCQKAIDGAPNRVKYHYLLALAYGMNGDAQHARQEAIEVQRLVPGYAESSKIDPWPGREAAFRQYADSMTRAAQLAGLAIAP